MRIKRILLLAGIALSLSACQSHPKGEAEPVVMPDYKDLIGGPWEEDTGPAPGAFSRVNVFFDNTGSMQRYIFNEKYQNIPDPAYVRFMRSLRDTGRLYDTHYYVLRENQEAQGKRGWQEYEGSINEDFTKPEFYFSWKNMDEDPGGPLSKLYYEKNGLNPQEINVVLTDLAEQNVNNTQLAQAIRDMCGNSKGEAYLFAFRFDYHGEAEVPNPDRVNQTVSRQLDGPRPFYVIVTGPRSDVRAYIKNMKDSLLEEQLAENRSYYMTDNRVDLDKRTLSPGEVEIQPAASLEEVKEEIKSGESRLSRNVVPYDSWEDLFCSEPEYQAIALRYEKAKGLPKKYSDWRLNLHIPLPEPKNPNLEYEISLKSYYLEISQEDGESGGAPESARWVEDGKLPVQVEIEETEHEGYDVKFTGKPGTVNGSGTVLQIIQITKKEKVPYRIPHWIEDFDTGSSDDYFQRTYNLKGFYDVLFGGQNKMVEGETMEFTGSYAVLPVIITNLDEGGRRR